jgi:uncharacterized membrane protein
MTDGTSEPSEAVERDDSVAMGGAGGTTLLLAPFATLDDAKEAYEQLKAVEDGRTLRIDGVVVLTHDTKGQLEVVKVTDHSTRTGLAWGALGGILVGFFFPPSLLAGAVVGGAAGAVVGKARQVHHKHEIADRLATTLKPGQSGLTAMVTDPRAERLQAALDKADEIVSEAIDDAVWDELRAAAKELEP